MDYGQDTTHDEFLIPRAQARAAFRTHYVLVAARLVFVFSHGVLVITSSMLLREGWELKDNSSWWIAFLPVWLGNFLCAVLIIYSWFASCPYIQLCLAERQARLGYANPSILTDILPQIVMAILGLFFIILSLVGEVLLCRYLENLGRSSSGKLGDDSIVPSATVLMIVAMLASCHGVCIRTNGDYFNSVGFGALATFIAAMCVPGGLVGSCSWVILVPSPIASLGILMATIRQSHSCGRTFSKEERLLRNAEQLVLGMVLVAFVVLICLLASSAEPLYCSAAGTIPGAGICFIVALRACLARVECRQTAAREVAASLAAAASVSRSVTASVTTTSASTASAARSSI